MDGALVDGEGGLFKYFTKRRRGLASRGDALPEARLGRPSSEIPCPSEMLRCGGCRREHSPSRSPRIPRIRSVGPQPLRGTPEMPPRVLQGRVRPPQDPAARFPGSRTRHPKMIQSGREQRRRDHAATRHHGTRRNDPLRTVQALARIEGLSAIQLRRCSFFAIFLTLGCPASHGWSACRRRGWPL